MARGQGDHTAGEVTAVLYGRTPGRDKTSPAHRRYAEDGLIFVPDRQLPPATVKELAHSFDHLFAIGMHRRYGWKIRAFGHPADEYTLGMVWREEENIDRPRHFYCLNYQNQPVDAYGVYEDEDALHRCWQQDHDEIDELISTDVTTEEIVDETRMFSYGPVTDEQLARVDDFLERLKLEELHD